MKLWQEFKNHFKHPSEVDQDQDQDRNRGRTKLSKNATNEQGVLQPGEENIEPAQQPEVRTQRRQSRWSSFSDWKLQSPIARRKASEQSSNTAGSASDGPPQIVLDVIAPAGLALDREIGQGETAAVTALITVGASGVASQHIERSEIGPAERGPAGAI